MPNLDGMGPNGAGPMTGRGMGNCQAQRGMGMGRRGGRCFYGNRGMGGYAGAPTLEEQASVLEDELKAVKEEIKRRKDEK